MSEESTENIPQETPSEPVAEPAEKPAEESAAEAPAAAEEKLKEDKPKQDKPKAEAQRKPPNTAMIRAYRSGKPVEGTIVEVNKGGYEVRVGSARGFCPKSQLALESGQAPESQVGQTLEFKITQLRRGGEDVVVSRRAITDADKIEEAKAVRATLIEGAVMQGRVAGAAEFGAFIDLGAGVMGLAHISELSHKRVAKVEEAVSVGDTVQVKILKLDEKRGRISLSIRRAVPNPWAGVSERFKIGQVYPGSVQRVTDFGAFVELAPGVEALAPASEFPPLSGGWKNELENGATLDWHVLSVQAKRRRISITPPGDGGVTEPVAVGATLNGKVQRIEAYGVFVWLGPGQVGLMPRIWSGTDQRMDQSFQIGDAVEVCVQEVLDDGHKIRLSKSGVDVSAAAPEQRERRERREPRERRERREDVPRAAQEDQGPFGTNLADKLRAALNKGEKS